MHNRRGRQTEPGYQNQSAAVVPPTPRYVHVPELCWTPEVRQFYERDDMQRRPGEDRLVWLERTRLERERVGLGMGAGHEMPPPQPASEAATALRLEFGPGVDDDVV